MLMLTFAVFNLKHHQAPEFIDVKLLYFSLNKLLLSLYLTCLQVLVLFLFPRNSGPILFMDFYR